MTTETKAPHMEDEIRQLFTDHSVALEFVREIAGWECAIDCENCIACRAKAWLHWVNQAATQKAEGDPR